jgi:hypothetical protein
MICASSGVVIESISRGFSIELEDDTSLLVQVPVRSPVSAWIMREVLSRSTEPRTSARIGDFMLQKR